MKLWRESRTQERLRWAEVHLEDIKRELETITSCEPQLLASRRTQIISECRSIVRNYEKGRA